MQSKKPDGHEVLSKHHKTRQNIYVVWGLCLTGREQVTFELLSRSKKILFIFCVSVSHKGGLGNSGLVHGIREWEYETYVSNIYCYFFSSPLCQNSKGDK